MRVALGQIPVSSQPAVNLERVRSALSEAARRGADLAVFPEATQIRFGCDPRPVAAPPDGPFGSALAAAAREAGVALVAGIFGWPRTAGCSTRRSRSTAPASW